MSAHTQALREHGFIDAAVAIERANQCPICDAPMASANHFDAVAAECCYACWEAAQEGTL